MLFDAVLKRNALALVLILIVCFSISIWFFYHQFGKPQEPVVGAEIEEFEWVSGFTPYIGLTLVNTVNLTVKNTGSSDISGLVLSVKLVYNGTELEFSQGFTEQIELLKSGEKLEISKWVFSYLGKRPKGTECVSALMMGEVILDERIDSIIWGEED